MAVRGFVAVREGLVLNSFILNLKFEYIKYSLPMWGFSGIMTQIIRMENYTVNKHG